jgi:hypothetical protein
MSYSTGREKITRIGGEEFEFNSVAKISTIS